MANDSEQQERWRVLREKLDRLARINPDGARVIEAIVDELLDERPQQQPEQRANRKGSEH